MAKILWIEDGAYADLQELVVPIYIQGRHDLTIALDASEGCGHLLQTQFDAVIVGRRIPPGNDRGWIELCNKKEKIK